MSQILLSPSPLLHNLNDLLNTATAKENIFPVIQNSYTDFRKLLCPDYKSLKTTIPNLSRQVLKYVKLLKEAYSTLDKNSANAMSEGFQTWLSVVFSLSNLRELKTLYMCYVIVPLLFKIKFDILQPWFVKELLKNCNAAIDGSEVELRNQAISKKIERLDRFINYMLLCGDYEFQEIILEIIFKMCSEDDLRSKASVWFENEILKDAFLLINRSNIKICIRKFLNVVNSAKGSVFSVKALQMIIEDVVLDENDENSIWIDINRNFKTISISMYENRLSLSQNAELSKKQDVLCAKNNNVSQIVKSRYYHSDCKMSIGNTYYINFDTPCNATVNSLTKETVLTNLIQVVILDSKDLQDFDMYLKRKFAVRCLSSQDPIDFDSKSFNDDEVIGCGEKFDVLNLTTQVQAPALYIAERSSYADSPSSLLSGHEDEEKSADIDLPEINLNYDDSNDTIQSVDSHTSELVDQENEILEDSPMLSFTEMSCNYSVRADQENMNTEDSPRLYIAEKKRTHCAQVEPQSSTSELSESALQENVNLEDSPVLYIAEKKRTSGSKVARKASIAQPLESAVQENVNLEDSPVLYIAEKKRTSGSKVARKASVAQPLESAIQETVNSEDSPLLYIAEKKRTSGSKVARKASIAQPLESAVQENVNLEDSPVLYIAEKKRTFGSKVARKASIAQLLESAVQENMNLEDSPVLYIAEKKRTSGSKVARKASTHCAQVEPQASTSQLSELSGQENVNFEDSPIHYIAEKKNSSKHTKSSGNRGGLVKILSEQFPDSNLLVISKVPEEGVTDIRNTESTQSSLQLVDLNCSLNETDSDISKSHEDLQLFLNRLHDDIPFTEDITNKPIANENTCNSSFEGCFIAVASNNHKSENINWSTSFAKGRNDFINKRKNVTNWVKDQNLAVKNQRKLKKDIIENDRDLNQYKVIDSVATGNYLNLNEMEKLTRENISDEDVNNQGINHLFTNDNFEALGNDVEIAMRKELDRSLKVYSNAKFQKRKITDNQARNSINLVTPSKKKKIEISTRSTPKYKFNKREPKSLIPSSSMNNLTEDVFYTAVNDSGKEESQIFQLEKDNSDDSDRTYFIPPTYFNPPRIFVDLTDDEVDLTKISEQVQEVMPKVTILSNQIVKKGKKESSDCDKSIENQDTDSNTHNSELFEEFFQRHNNFLSCDSEHLSNELQNTSRSVKSKTQSKLSPIEEGVEMSQSPDEPSMTDEQASDVAVDYEEPKILPFKKCTRNTSETQGTKIPKTPTKANVTNKNTNIVSIENSENVCVEEQKIVSPKTLVKSTKSVIEKQPLIKDGGPNIETALVTAMNSDLKSKIKSKSKTQSKVRSVKDRTTRKTADKVCISRANTDDVDVRDDEVDVQIDENVNIKIKNKPEKQLKSSFIEQDLETIKSAVTATNISTEETGSTYKKKSKPKIVSEIKSKIDSQTKPEPNVNFKSLYVSLTKLNLQSVTIQKRIKKPPSTKNLTKIVSTINESKNSDRSRKLYNINDTSHFDSFFANEENELQIQRKNNGHQDKLAIGGAKTTEIIESVPNRETIHTQYKEASPLRMDFLDILTCSPSSSPKGINEEKFVTKKQNKKELRSQQMDEIVVDHTGSSINDEINLAVVPTNSKDVTHANNIEDTSLIRTTNVSKQKEVFQKISCVLKKKPTSKQRALRNSPVQEESEKADIKVKKKQQQMDEIVVDHTGSSINDEINLAVVPTNSKDVTHANNIEDTSLIRTTNVSKQKEVFPKISCVLKKKPTSKQRALRDSPVQEESEKADIKVKKKQQQMDEIVVDHTASSINDEINLAVVPANSKDVTPANNIKDTSLIRTTNESKQKVVFPKISCVLKKKPTSKQRALRDSPVQEESEKADIKVKKKQQQMDEIVVDHTASSINDEINLAVVPANSKDVTPANNIKDTSLIRTTNESKQKEVFQKISCVLKKKPTSKQQALRDSPVQEESEKADINVKKKKRANQVTSPQTYTLPKKTKPNNIQSRQNLAVTQMNFSSQESDSSIAVNINGRLSSRKSTNKTTILEQLDDMQLFSVNFNKLSDMSVGKIPSRKPVSNEVANKYSFPNMRRSIEKFLIDLNKSNTKSKTKKKAVKRCSPKKKPAVKSTAKAAKQSNLKGPKKCSSKVSNTITEPDNANQSIEDLSKLHEESVIELKTVSPTSSYGKYLMRVIDATRKYAKN